MAQLAGSALCSRGRIVEFMRKSRRKLSQRSQPVLLLFAAGGFTDPVRHQAHETLGQHRHFLYKIWKQRGRKSEGTAVSLGSQAHLKLLHSGKRQHSGNIARLEVKNDSFARKISPPLKSPLKDHEHCIGWIALARVDITRLGIHFLRLADEPVHLIVWQISEFRNAT